MKVEIQASSLGSKMIMPSVSVDPAEGLKNVMGLYILIEPEVQNEVSLLVRAQVDCIRVRNKVGGILGG